ncbi:hypothetical protein D3C81_1579840 [compost metagenome]
MGYFIPEGGEELVNLGFGISIKNPVASQRVSGRDFGAQHIRDLLEHFIDLNFGIGIQNSVARQACSLDCEVRHHPL